MGVFSKFKILTDFLQFKSDYIALLVAMLFSLSFHELAHGVVAYFFGDSTAKNLGRLTLNPLKHLNLMGSLCLIFFGFGWANPVPININNFSHPKRDMAFVAIAGPMSNLLLVFFGFFTYKIHCVMFSSFYNTSFNHFFICLLRMFVFLNCSLMVFNLIPIPPLDGSRIITAFLPNKIYLLIMKYEFIGSFIVMFLLYKGNLRNLLSFNVYNTLKFFNLIFNI